MSLSRILNDVPSSLPPPSSSTLNRLLNDDRPPSVSSGSQAQGSHDLRESRNGSPHMRSPSSNGVTNGYHHSWNAYNGDYSKSDSISQRPSSPPYREANRSPVSVTHQDSYEYAHPNNASHPRKRRRTSDMSADFPRRVTRHTAKSALREPSPVNHGPMADSVDAEEDAEAERLRLQEEARLASSDLEDSKDIWFDEVGRYAMETHLREVGVESWFERELMERTGTIARERVHKYMTRILSFPSPPPPLRPALSSHARRSLSFDDESALQSGDEDFSRSHHYDLAGQDAAQALEESLLGTKKHHNKRRSYRVSEDGSDFDVPSRDRHTSKKRKLEDMDDITDDLERSVADDASRAATPSGFKRSGKMRGRKGEVEGTKRKGLGKKRKGDDLGSEINGSFLMDPRHNLHGPEDVSSSAPSPTGLVIYDLDEIIPPMQKPRKLQGTAASKRIAAVQEAQRKVWSVIAIKEIPRVHKYQTASYIAKSSHLKRLAHLCTNQARKPHVKTIKATKEMQLKSKRLMRDMLVFWRKNEKEERDGRKRAEKEAVERAKEEEEKREAARQARKLEFLISQTELYSHFVGNKLKTAEAEQSAEVGTSETPVEGPSVLPAGVELDDESPVDPTSLQDLNFDDDDQTNLYRHAKRNAQDAIAAAKQRAQEFDTQAILDRKTNEALALAAKQSHIHDDDSSSEVAKAGQAPLTDLDSDELNFQNPTSLSGQLTIAQPRMLMAQLKEYQLKGLNWLATLYEQGINGILADEMGLGKTVQSISLLAYLAETHDIWGPFLVIAPASTLHNWQQELSRFVPDLKALPYWGNVKDRTVLRKFWNRKQISYNKDAPFHVLITSYQLVLADEKYFQRVNWQYMILDEAQNIKNSSSARWKTLLSFHCRNRLLLTGTPIQNSMQELWALLHFIMPSLFDSHDEFSEWFSKDIENAAENKGSKLNEHQLRRLHMILKPFMLRRVKRHVQNELSEKIEIDIYCDLSYRQRALYRALRANVSITELLEKAANIGDADSARSLMNLVMQFRKVCNHPELFERADVVAPYSFCHFGAGNPLREGDFLHLPYSTRSPLEFHIPSLFYLDGGLVSVPSEDSQAGQETRYLYHLMNIWSTDWMEKSIQENSDSPFNFIPLLDRTTSEIHSLYHSPEFMRLAWASHENAEWIENAPFLLDSDFVLNGIAPPLLIARPRISEYYETAEGLPPLGFIGHRMWMQSCLSRPALQWGIAPAMAPPLTLVSGERTLVDKIGQIQEAPLESLALYGLPPSIVDTEPACHKFNSLLPHIPIDGFLKNSPSYQLPWSTMQVPDAKRLIFDSAKLARLDTLLQELKAGDHKVLVYFQMTKMMDLMEEYLIYRQYKYLRLDGSSKLEDRRDMVMDWQTRPDIFIFLLSTRAGGLGINLTAADTVVFYDHDWNPSNDSQAMDRAHRLGQTRQVTVYRLITKGTIDERIIQLARVKKDVQDIVVGNKQFTDVAKPSEIVSLLLNDDELATLGAQGSSMDRLKASDSSTSDKRGSGRNGKDQTSTSIAGPSTRDLWNEEGDDFFGSSATVPNGSAAILDEEAPAASTPSTRGRKNGTGTGTGAKRGRKPGSGKGVGHRKKPGPVTGDTLPEDL